MTRTFLPAVKKVEYVYKLDWETRQLEADDSEKKNYQDLVTQKRGTFPSFWMGRCVCPCVRACVHVKDRDDDEVNFLLMIIFFGDSTEMKEPAQPL